jgi:hypothetical protein
MYMRNAFKFGAALLLATSLAGCSVLQSAVDFVNQPATQSALSALEGLTITVGKITGGVACFVSTNAATALAAEAVPVFGVSAAGQATTQAVYAASELACATLGGQAAGAAPAGAVGVVSASHTAALGRRFRVVVRR